MANELRADLAVFTGDLITEPGDPLNDAIRELVRMRASDGVTGRCMWKSTEAYVGCRNYLERHARPAVNFLRLREYAGATGAEAFSISWASTTRRNADSAICLAGTERLIRAERDESAAFAQS